MWTSSWRCFLSNLKGFFGSDLTSVNSTPNSSVYDDEWVQLKSSVEIQCTWWISTYLASCQMHWLKTFQSYWLKRDETSHLSVSVYCVSRCGPRLWALVCHQRATAAKKMHRQGTTPYPANPANQTQWPNVPLWELKRVYSEVMPVGCTSLNDRLGAAWVEGLHFLTLHLLKCCTLSPTRTNSVFTCLFLFYTSLDFDSTSSLWWD